MNDARHVATLIRRRIDEVSAQMRKNPALVRVVTGNNGDSIAMWFADDGTSREYNLSDAQRRLSGLVAKYGTGILKTRSGQVLPINFNLGLS